MTARRERSASQAIGGRDSLARIERDVVACERCPRLVEHCRTTAREKRRAYAGETYWGKPVPGFGDANARIWVLGLAPAAHGGNRTGRVFTGDRSGDFLYAALHRAGLANQPESIARDDGLELRDVWISAAGRCAPPANQPTREELASCAEYLEREARALERWRVVVCLGGIAWTAALDLLARLGHPKARPKPRFAHGARYRVGAGEDERLLLGSYHVSQQNTFTGRLTPAMLDRVLADARRIAER